MAAVLAASAAEVPSMVALRWGCGRIFRFSRVHPAECLKARAGGKSGGLSVLFRLARAFARRGTSAAKAGGSPERLNRSGKPLRHPKALRCTRLTDGGPDLASSDTREHLTEFVIAVQRWSDGTEHR